jgi:hypothetical protein
MLNANQLHELRLAAGLSIYALGERAGVHWLTVINAEKPERRIRPDTRRRLERALREAVEERAVLVAAARLVLAAA